MNFGADGIHRMFRLTQHSPREDWDELSNFDFGTSCTVMPYGQGNPRTGNVNNLGTTVQRELIGTVGAGTLEVSVRSDGDDGGSQFFLNP